METIKLDLIPGKKMPSLHASQYDDGRTHGIDLTNLGEEWKLDGTETLTINERKVDNNICSMDIENTFTGSSHIEFASFLQMCACAGSNFCELRISKGDVDIGTLNFILEVEPDPTADGIESESEIRNLKAQVEAITEEVIGDDYYTKTQTDNAIANATEGKADKTYVDTELAKKADKSNTYTKTEVDTLIDNLPEPMIFKGTLGVGGTIQSLPDASASNEGYTYKVITDGTYAGQTAKVGDVFTSNGSEWVYIPSGDEDNDTWRAIKVNGTEVLGNGISSGAVDFVGSENIEIDFDGNGNKVGVKTKNIYTKTEVDSIVANEVSEAIYNILPSELTPTSPIANFSTTLELPIVDISVDNSATKIYQFGSNLWNEEWEQGTYDTTTGEKTASTTLKRNIKPIPVKENTTYTRVKTQTGVLLACRLFFYDDDMNLLATKVNTSNIYSFTTPVGCSFLNFAFQNNITALSVNYPDTDTALNTYNPASGEYPIAEKDNIIPFVGVNNIFTDVGDISVEYKVSIEQYVSNHSGGGLGGGLLGGGLGGAKNGGSEETEKEIEEPKEEPKEEVKEIGEEPISKK